MGKNQSIDEIFVLDTETTGLDGHPDDIVLEIAIIKVNLLDKTFKKIYDSVLGYDVSKWSHYWRNAWIFDHSTLTLEEIRNAKDSKTVINEVREIVKDKVVTSYNTAYDFDKFLNLEPWKLNEVTNRLGPCIMKSATEVCEIPGYYQEYKWPKLEEAYSKLVRREKKDSIQPHRALGDTIMASNVLLALYPDNYVI